MRFIATFILLALAAVISAVDTLPKYFGTVQNRDGRAQTAVPVLVSINSSGAHAVLYEDDEVTLKANPLTTDANGAFAFKVAGGVYDITTTKNGQSVTQTHVQIALGGGGGGGAGTVTSVALTLPSEFSVTGTPVTGAGTFVASKANQAANKIWAGPSSGVPAAPAFRSMVAADLPSTAVTPGSYTTANITVDAQGRLTAASNGSPAGSGTVTSVALTLPSEFSVAGTPITTNGTLAATKANQAAHTAWVGPSSGAAAAPTFRQPTYNDVATASKLMVSAVATTNVSISSAPATIDGVSLAISNRVLLTGQTTASQNGFWVFVSAGSAMNRPEDFASGNTVEAFQNECVYALGGTVNAGTTWRLATASPLVIDTDSMTWSIAPVNVSSTATVGQLVSANMSTTGVAAGSYTSANLTVDAAGRVTAASNGSGGGGGGGTVQALTGTAVAPSVASGSWATWILTGTSTFAAPSLSAGQEFRVQITNDASTPYSVTFSGVTWPGGTAPQVTQVVSAVDVLYLYNFNGTTYGDLVPRAAPFTANGVMFADSNGFASSQTGFTFSGGNLALPNPLTAANGGLGLNASAAANGQIPIGTGTGFALGNLTAGTNISITNTSGGIQIDSTATPSFPNQTANTVYAGPTSGGAAAPAFRGIASADLTTALTTPGPIGATTASTGAFTTLTASTSLSASLGLTNCEYHGLSVGRSASTGTDNIVLGRAAARNFTTGSFNTGVGVSVFDSNLTGSNNAAFGYTALWKNTAAQNTAFGSAAGQQTTSGGSNTYIGYAAGKNGVTAGTNTAVGSNALTTAAGASDANCVAVGSGALGNMNGTSGGGNTAIGQNAGNLITTGSNNILIGRGADRTVSTTSQGCVIGSSSAVMNDMWVGAGEAAASAGSITIHATDATGTDIAATQMRIAGGRSTGTGAGGAVKIQTANASGVSGAAANTLADRVIVEQTGNISIGAAPTYGSGVGVIFIQNATTNPSANPTGGSILYADTGALKARGTSGTVTTIAPAEPHCPVCGSDFCQEWENPKYGHLIVCMKCLAKELGARPYITQTAGTDEAPVHHGFSSKGR